MCHVNKIKIKTIKKFKNMEKVSLEDLLNIVRAKTSTEVSMSSYLTNDLGLDSLDMAELVIQLGKALGFEIPDEEAEKFHTVQDVWDYIQVHQDDAANKGE